MTLDEITKLIDELSAINYEEHSPENYGLYLPKAKQVLYGAKSTLISPYETDTFSIYRARKSSTKQVFHNLGEVWYPPVFDVKAQRLNFPYKPLFYGSTDISTALIEVNPQLGDYITMIELGITNRELKCIQLVPEKHGDSLDKMDPVKRAAFDFIVKEVRKIVPDGQIQGYYATQIYTQGLIESMDSNSWDGIAYNSVATLHKGYNFAIKPDFIDRNYKFLSATLFKVIDYVDRNDFVVACLLSANSISTYGRMQFEKIKSCPTHQISLNNYQN